MQITVTFDSMEEFIRHLRPMEGFEEEAPQPEKPRFEQAQEHVQALQQEVEAEQPAPDPEPAPAPAVTEDFRAEVRRAMAKLNKQTGQNTAKDLITAIGFTKLSEVPLEMLPGLMEQVKEAANA